jgi:hypothetical protein
MDGTPVVWFRVVLPDTSVTRTNFFRRPAMSRSWSTAKCHHRSNGRSIRTSVSAAGASRTLFKSLPGRENTAYADELLALARRLSTTRTAILQQASFRRAISTAYYALFHLLVGEATSNWSREDDRHLMGRLFGHGKMKAACNGSLFLGSAWYRKAKPSLNGRRLTTICRAK